MKNKRARTQVPLSFFMPAVIRVNDIYLEERQRTTSRRPAAQPLSGA